MGSDDPCLLPATGQARALRDGSLGAVELVEAHLAPDRADQPGGERDRHARRRPGDRGRARTPTACAPPGGPLPPLHGLPIAHKDLVDTAGVRTTYGSPSYRDHVPGEDALVAARLRDAGAIMVGKTNTPEWGAGSHTFNPVFGATRNPWDTARSAGGSSGGGAVALACRMVPLADGSDLGGSLRNPAAWNGLVGLRPTPGVVPDWPSLTPWLPFSVAGPMGRTAGRRGAAPGRDGRARPAGAALAARRTARSGRAARRRPARPPGRLEPVARRPAGRAGRGGRRSRPRSHGWARSASTSWRTSPT